MKEKIILASNSARRKKILSALEIDFDSVVPEINEVCYTTDARRTARDNAARKSIWCRTLYPDRHSITADTTLEFEDRCVTKPHTTEEAIAFLKMFSGKTHLVYTAVAMARPFAEPELILTKASVRFHELSDVEIQHYISSVHPMDRAGAYDIDEQGEILIAGYTGARTTIMGLPRETVRTWLSREGLL